MAANKRLNELAAAAALAAGDLTIIGQGTNAFKAALSTLKTFMDGATVSQADAEAGTATVAERWTPQRVAQALNAIGVTATGSTTARSLAERAAEVFNVKDWGATGDGVTDDSAAFQAALDAIATAGEGVWYFPAGDYVLGSQVSKSTSVQEIAIVGAGVEVTRLIVPSTNTTGAISLTFTDKTNQVTLRDFSLLADGKQLGVGLQITQPEGGNRHNRTVYMDRVEIKGIDVTEDCFVTGLDLTGCWRPLLNAVIVGGPFGPGVSGDNTDASALYFSTLAMDLDDCYSPAIHNCYIWSAITGISSVTSGSAEEEGFHMTGTKIVEVKVAVNWVRTAREPEFWVDNCHWNYRDDGLILDGAKFVSIKGCLPFNEDTVPDFTGTPHDIHLKNTEVVVITDNVFHFGGNPTKRIGVFADATTNADNIIIGNNIFSGTFNEAIRVGAGASAITISGNRYPGTITTNVNDLSGSAIITDPGGAGEWVLEGQSAGASAFPIWSLYRNSPSPVATDVLAQRRWQGNTDAGNKTDYVQERVIIDDPADLSEDAHWEMFAQIAGTLTKELSIGKGLQVGSPTGGAKGAGSVNLDGLLFRDGTQILTTQQASVADASGGGTIDAEARTAINALLARLRTHGIVAT